MLNSSGFRWLTDYIQPSDSLADDFSSSSVFLEEDPSTGVKFEAYETDCCH